MSLSQKQREVHSMQSGKGAIIRQKTSLVIAGEHSPQLTVRELYSVDAFNALWHTAGRS